VYIRIGNLINSMPISIQYPCLHGGVVISSWLCHYNRNEGENKREEKAKNPCRAYTQSGGIATSPSCKQGRLSTCHRMQIPYLVPGCPGSTAQHEVCCGSHRLIRIARRPDAGHWKASMPNDFLTDQRGQCRVQP
jgi:hypothetical protein